MGIWGVGLYDNDCTLDIRDEFQYLISNGYLPCAAAKKVRQQFADMFLDAEDGHRELYGRTEAGRFGPLAQ